MTRRSEAEPASSVSEERYILRTPALDNGLLDIENFDLVIANDDRFPNRFADERTPDRSDIGD